MNITIQKILEFHDLFPDEKELNISEILKKYSKEYLVRCSHVLSNNYGKSFIPDSKNTFFSEISKERIDDLNKRFAEFKKHQSNAPYCYCTTKTALELMRIIFSIPNEEYTNKGDIKDFEYDLFRVLLQINENLMHYKHNQKLDLATLTFLLFYVMNDITEDNISDSFVRQVQYYAPLANFIENNPKCEKAKLLFYNNAGISSMKQYVKTWLSLVTLVINYQKKSLKVCPILDINNMHDIDNCIAISVLDFLSINISDYIPYTSVDNANRDNNVDYRIFRAHPLIKLNESKYLIYSLPILVERLYNSLFFDLKKGFKDPFNFYNTEFVERTLFQPQILKCLNEKKTTKLYPDQETIMSAEKYKEMPNQPDFYIRENDCLILFECKAIRINGELKDQADVEILLSSIKNKLYLSIDNIDKTRGDKKNAERVGVTQLVHQMKMIDEDSFIWDKNIPNEVAYYPVLVLENPKIASIGMSYIINSWYKSLIAKELPEQMCHPIVVMSINTLITYSFVFKKYGFHYVFDQYFNKTVKYSQDGITWTIDPMSDFHSFLQNNYKLSKNQRKKMHEDSMANLL